MIRKIFSYKIAPRKFLSDAYGKAVLKNLAQQLTVEFGKGLYERNLNNMRAFCNAFPIWNAVRAE